MDVKDYLRIFRRYWWLVVLLTVVGAGLGYGTQFIHWWFFTPKYKSTVTLFVATQTGTTVSEAYQNNLFSTDRTVSYASLASSEQVAARAVDELKAPISPGQLRSKISATARDKTVLLDVSVSDPSPAKAQEYANAVGDSLVGLVGELETSRRGGTPAAAAAVVDDANYPIKPAGFWYGLKLWMRIALAAVAGLVVGLVVALLTGVFDKRLRGRENIESVTGSLVIGTLPRDPLRANVDVVDLDNNTAYAERIRELRTNLRFTMTPDGSPPRLIAVTSPTRHDGRTTTAIDLAAALAESGRSVLLVDGDLRSPALADRLSIEDALRDHAAQRGLSTVLVGEHDLADALIPEVPVGAHWISLLPAGPEPPRPGELWATDRAEALFEDLGDRFDYVVVDTPPVGTCTDGAIIGALCDGALVLARIRGTTTTALRRALQALQSAHVTVLGAVATFEPVSRLAPRRHSKQRATASGAARQGPAVTTANFPQHGSVSESDDVIGPISDPRLVKLDADGQGARAAHEKSQVQGESR